MVPRWTNPPERNTKEWMEAFARNPRLAVVERIASDLSFASGKLYELDRKGNEQELSAHPFLDFWNHPNPLHEMSGAALWRLLETYLKLKGEGYFIVEKDALGCPAELWPVPVHWVQMTPYQGFPFYTVRLTSGQMMDVSVDDMFVMKDLNPIDPFRRGLGQAEALADEIETDEYAAKFQKKFFERDATPSILIGMPKSTKDQRDRLRAQWREWFGGVFKSHGIATVDGEFTIEKLSENMKDMDMVNGRTFIRNAVLEHFGVPREIMGITESSNRATSEAAQYIYAQNVLMPSLRRREEAVNQQLLPLFGESLVWRYDNIIPRNQEFDKIKALDGWNTGLLTKDEARELLDMPPAATGGGVYKMQFSDLYLPANADPASYALATEDTGQSKIEIEEGSEPFQKAAERKGTAAEAVRLRASEQEIRAAETEGRRKFEGTVRQYFQGQNQRIQEALEGSIKADSSTVWDILKDSLPENTIESGYFIALEEQERMDLASKFVRGLLDWKQEETLLQSLFKPLWKETYSKGTEVAARLKGLTGINRPELVSSAKLRGGARIHGITQTTQANVSRVVAAALETGTNREELAKQIQQELSIGMGRARLIADQECGTSLNAGQFDMMKKAGARTKTWHTFRDRWVRDSHQKLNNITIPIDEVFSSKAGAKLRFPRDPDCGIAKEVINCRCWITYD